MCYAALQEIVPIKYRILAIGMFNRITASNSLLNNTQDALNFLE